MWTEKVDRRVGPFAISRYYREGRGLGQAFGYALPWAETLLGLLLILGLGLKFVAPAAILITASFIAGTAGTLYLFGTKGP